jgi:Fe2+ transport system protein A
MLASMSDLKLRDNAKILSFEIPNPADRQKLFACGLIPGAMITVEHIAPLGDPMQLRLNGDILLSIRKSEARYVKVDCINR